MTRPSCEIDPIRNDSVLMSSPLDSAPAVHDVLRAAMPTSPGNPSPQAVSLHEAMQVGIAHHKANRLNDAEAIFRQVLTKQPNHPDALYFLGACAFQRGNAQGAIDLIVRAIALHPKAAAYHANLGVLLATQHKVEDAIKAFRCALELKPDYPDALYNLGTALLQSGKTEEAITELRKAMNQRADHFDTCLTLAKAMKKIKNLEGAIDAYQKAVAIKPDSFDTIHNLAIVQHRVGRYDDAIASYQAALKVKPGDASVLCNFGTSLQCVQRYDEAVDAFRKSLEAEPHRPIVHGNLGMLLLVQGDFKNGWPEYEWRCQTQEWHRNPARERFMHPRWDGSDLNGKTILLHTEQGFGDTIHFARYAELVAARGGKVILECSKFLTRLVATIPGVSQTIARGDTLPEFDVQCSLLTLPMLFETVEATIPNKVPYLSAEANLSDRWRDRIGDEQRLKVGIAWAGQPEHANDRERSIGLAALAPLARVAGVRFFSLQKGDRAKESESPPPGMDLSDWTAEINDFADTAALIQNLDLIITADTAPAHLAGAMGKPVWVLIPANPDWRWMLHRTDSPWYPTMKLIRKTALGDWNPAVERAAADLKALLTGS